MASIDDSDVPETGAVFTFGRSRFADNLANKFWIRNDKIVHVACGDEHSMVVTDRGRLYGFGANDWGQLGLGHTKSANKPTFVRALKGEKITLVACGRTHTLGATASGKVFSFGAGGDGQLGHGDTEDSPFPKQIAGLPLEKVKILSCGVYHSAVLYESGDLYIWGASGEGQTGQEEEELNCPTILSLDEKVSWVSCGYYHTALVTESGRLFTFGESEHGKLGLKEEQLKDTSRPQPVATNGGHFTAVACGSGHTLALNQDGRVFSFGDGSRGQLGQGTRVQELKEPSMIQQLGQMKVKFVSCGDCHSAVLTENGTLFTFGDGRHGKLGQGEECFSNQFRPVKVARFEKFNVESVSCGGCHTLVTALIKEPGVSDEEDAEDGLLNASMASEYSGVSMEQANATLRPFSLSNTAPVISPRDKRRQKESESLANSFSGAIGSQKGSSLGSLALDRSRLPQIRTIAPKEAKEERIGTKVQSREYIMADKNIIRTMSGEVENENKKNINNDVDNLRRKIEDELNEEAEKAKEMEKKVADGKKPVKKQEESEEESGEEYDTDEEDSAEDDKKDTRKVGENSVIKKEDDKNAEKVSNKLADEGEDDEEEESEYETDEEEEDEEDEEDAEEEFSEKLQKKNDKPQDVKKSVMKNNSKKTDAKVEIASESQRKVAKEDKNEDDDEEEEEDDDDEEEDEDDEEEEEDEEDEDDEGVEDDENEEEDEEEDEEDEDVTEKNKEKDKSKSAKENESGKKEKKKEKKDAKKDLKSEKEKAKNKKENKKESDKKDNEEDRKENEQNIDEGKEEVNNNQTENSNEGKIEDSQPQKKSMFGNIFGKKKQQKPVKNGQTSQQQSEKKPEDSSNQSSQNNPDQKSGQDAVDGPKQVNSTKKSGKSGVCAIL